MADSVIDLLFKLGDLLRDVGIDFLKDGRVDRDAGQFHIDQDRHERQLDVLKQ